MVRGERRFEKPLRREGLRVGFEEASPSIRKEFMRSDSDNWRTLREEHEQEEAGDPGGSWRLAGSRRDGTCAHTDVIIHFIISFFLIYKGQINSCVLSSVNSIHLFFQEHSVVTELIVITY